MKVDVSINAVVLVSLYAPATAGVHTVKAISKIAGGCTILTGYGEWLNFGYKWVNEPIIKYEWVFSKEDISKVDLVELGEDFLEENPKELEVLFTVTGADGTMSVRCTRNKLGDANA